MADNVKPLWLKVIMAILLLGTAPLAYTVEFWTGYDSGFGLSMPILGTSSLAAGFLLAGVRTGISRVVILKGILFFLGVFILNFLFMSAIWIIRL